MNRICPFCSSEIYKSNLCKKHYELVVVEYKQITNEKQSSFDIKNHFHNLRHKIYYIRDINKLTDCLLKLISLGYAYYYFTNDPKLVTYSITFSYDQINKKNEYNKGIQEDKNLLLQKKISDLDFREKWPKKYQTEDGRLVRSLSEKTIADWLFYHSIIYIYEPRCYLPKNKSIWLSPDFYLRDYNVYIEYWSDMNPQYITRRLAKKELYKENNIFIIDITKKEIGHLDDFLLPILMEKDSN